MGFFSWLFGGPEGNRERGMKERWLSTLVRCLNWLEQQPPSQALARQALRRLGFMASED